MKAIRFHEHGGPDVLQFEDVAEPALGPGEVLLRVRAVSVMRTLDCEVRSRPRRIRTDPDAPHPGRRPGR